MSRVRLVTNASRVRNAVRDAVAPTTVLARGASRSTAPRTADAVVTTGRLTSGAEYLAASLGCPYVFVLPEAGDFLCDWLARHEPRDGDTAVLVGVDVGDDQQLAKAGLNSAHDEEVELK